MGGLAGLGGCPANLGGFVGARAGVCGVWPGGGGAGFPEVAGDPIWVLPRGFLPEFVGFDTVPLLVLMPTIEARLAATEEPWFGSAIRQVS